MSATFSHFDKVKNIRQHDFETKKGLIFDYALIFNTFLS